MSHPGDSNRVPSVTSKQATPETVTSSPRDGLWCSVLAVSAFVFLAWRATSFFPNAHGLLGHDYGWFVPTLIMGEFWHQQNGWWALPHFTPALCGGVPFLANPQSVYFSLPQLLMRVLEPTPALFATLLVSATAGAAGCYVLLRRSFEVSVHAATLGATLFLLNGFLFYRMVVGHLTYHAIAIAPLLAYVVASSQKTASITGTKSMGPLVLRIVAGGLLIAYVTYGGALNFQIPLVLTVSCALLMLQIQRGLRMAPWFVLGGSCLWGVLLSAMKMVPAAIFVAQFPRPYLRSYLFDSPVETMRMLLTGLFVPAALSDTVHFPSGFALDRHEFEFGVSVVPLVLMCWRHGIDVYSAPGSGAGCSGLRLG